MKLEKTSIAGIYKQALQNGDTTWYGKYRDPITKQSVRKKLGSKLKNGIKKDKEALIVLNKLLEARRKYNNDTLEETSPEYQNYLTLNELADKYFDSRFAKKRRILREQYSYLNDTVFEQYQVVKGKLQNVKNEVNRYNSNVRELDMSKLNVNRITKAHIKHYIEVELYKKNLSQKSKFNIISLIKTIFNYGIKEEIISIQNPFEYVKFKNPKRQRERVLSQEEIAKLLTTCKKEKEKINIYLSVYLAVLTGGRSNTILNIKKKDIDTENNIISLYNFKASRQYRIRISEGAIKWLKEKILPYYENDEFIIRSSRPGYRKNPPEPLSAIPKPVYDIMDKLFNQELDKQNNYDRDKVVNFHTIRRSIASNLAKKGTPLYDVMIFLNHSNIEQTMKYLNLDSNELHESINSLMDDIFKDFSKNKIETS